MISVAGLGGTAEASVVYTASGTPAGLSATATATFSITGTTLTINLVSSGGGAGNYGPGSGLSGLFFDIAGMNSLSLTPASATIAAGSTIVNAASCNPGPCTGVTNVAGEWGYQNSPGGFAGGPNASYGIASSGYLTTGLAGNIGNFNNGAAGTNLDGPNSLDGGNFELLPNGVSFNGGLSNVPVVETEIDFVLAGVPANLLLTDIRNVSFQFGTAFNETNLPGTHVDPPPAVPEPASMLLLASGLIGLWGIRRYRDHQRPTPLREGIGIISAPACCRR